MASENRLRPLLALLAALLFFGFSNLAEAKKLPKVVFEWEQPQILGRGGYVRLTRLLDGRLACSYTAGGNAWIRYSSDNGNLWSDPEKIASLYEVSDESGRSAILDVANPEIAQLGADNPHHPGRIICAVNLRPRDRRSSVHPYAIATCHSDDNGASWSPLSVCYLSEKWSEDKLKGCWEPFVQELPDGTLQIYFSDETPYYKEGLSHQNISVVESSDGGDSFCEPRIVSYSWGARDGMPSVTLCDGYMYMALESNPNGYRLHPQVVFCPVGENWKETVDEYSSRRFNPFATPVESKEDTYGAPYLIHTDNFFVISYQTSEGADIKVPSQRVMEVQACPRAEARKGVFRTMRGVSRPLDIDPREESVMWNSLFHLGKDDIMACCQYNGQVTLVRGKVRLEN